MERHLPTASPHSCCVWVGFPGWRLLLGASAVPHNGGQPSSFPWCLSSGFTLSLQSFPAGWLRASCGGEQVRGGGRQGEHPPSELPLLLKPCRSRRCGSPELVAQQRESINMLCRKCRGSPRCCQREGRRLRVTQDPTPTWHPFSPTPSSPSPVLATILYPFFFPYSDLETVPPNPSGKAAPCSRTPLLQGFCC